jgi:hypothetical protein
MAESNGALSLAGPVLLQLYKDLLESLGVSWDFSGRNKEDLDRSGAGVGVCRSSSWIREAYDLCA